MTYLRAAFAWAAAIGLAGCVALLGWIFTRAAWGGAW